MFMYNLWNNLRLNMLTFRVIGKKDACIWLFFVMRLMSILGDQISTYTLLEFEVFTPKFYSNLSSFWSRYAEILRKTSQIPENFSFCPKWAIVTSTKNWFSMAQMPSGPFCTSKINMSIRMKSIQIRNPATKTTSTSLYKVNGKDNR